MGRPTADMLDDGVHPLPDNAALRGDLKYPAGRTLTDQNVAVRQPIRPRYMSTEELNLWGRQILPHDFIGLRVDFYDARPWDSVAVHPVIEDLDVAIGKESSVVLMEDVRLAVIPH